MSDPYAALGAECEAFLETRGADVAHDLEHIRRVVANARQLAGPEGADLDVLVPAAWLHDCVHVPKTSPDRPRASRLAVEEATRWLTRKGYAPERLAAIAHAIEAHSFSAGIEPRTVEARVLQDADRLDALGAVGLARCIMLGGALGRPLYVPEDPFCERREPDDALSSVDHFYTKLLRLAPTFQTTAGRAEAHARTAMIRQFLDALRHELAWTRD